MCANLSRFSSLENQLYVDQGGPLGEYFGLVNSAAQERLMSQFVFRHNISAYNRGSIMHLGSLLLLAYYKDIQALDVSLGLQLITF
jgi:hypothetical protein